MTATIKNDLERAMRKLSEIKDRVHEKMTTFSVGADDVINTVALSNEISNELKEVLILLHTTSVTEMTASKIDSYRVSLIMIDTAENIISLQNKIIDKLVLIERSSVKRGPNNIWEFLKVYKTPVSVIMIISIIWLLTVVNGGAMTLLFDKLPALLGRVPHA